MIMNCMLIRKLGSPVNLVNLVNPVNPVNPRNNLRRKKLHLSHLNLPSKITIEKKDRFDISNIFAESEIRAN